MSVGYRIDFSNDTSMDISYTTGENVIDYVTSNSINSSFANMLQNTTVLTPAEIRAAVPREAKAYGLQLGLTTVNIDFTQDYDELFLAFGAELRTDEFKEIAGDEYSYRDYDTDAAGTNLYAFNADGAIQGFNGIGPQSEVDETRDVFSFYVDGEYDVNSDLHLNAAARYDDYDGFGDTLNFKLAGSLQVLDNLRFRSAVSTGFRAPSMQQLYFNNVSTQFRADGMGGLVAVQVGTFRNDSTLAQSIGIPQLKEEESTNFSFGVVTELTDNLSLTLDYYSIDIQDRIVISNTLGTGLSASLDAALLQAGAGAGQFFLNGADTETSGFDLVATYNGIDLMDRNLNVTLAGNWTSTDVTKLFTPNGSGLETLPTSTVFSSQDVSIIEEWQPESRISLSGAYSRDALAVNLAFNQYGEYTVTDGGRQTYGAKILTDLSIAYSLDNGVTLRFAGNNIFDVYPDKNTIGNSRNGAIEDGPAGALVVDSDGVFQYSRRSAPFGFNGAYFSFGVAYDF